MTERTIICNDTDMLAQLDEMSRCNLCQLSTRRHRIVLGRGHLPCDLLLIGEAPGRGEDISGIPFIGPAGLLLNKTLRRVVEEAKISNTPRLFITNVLACRPCETQAGENRQPTSEETWACWGRLKTTIGFAAPKAIVLVGKVAQALRKDIPHHRMYDILHPAYLLRSGGERSPQYPRWLREWMTIMSEVMNNG